MRAERPGPCQPLRLADHVRARVVGDQAVLLDLKRSRYHGVAAEQWRAAIASMAHGPEPTHPGSYVPSAAALVDRLLRAGIVTTAPAGTRTKDEVPPPATTIDLRLASPAFSITVRHLGHFIVATVRAALWLRFRSLHSIARSVGELHRSVGPSEPTRGDELRGAVAVFDRLRPLAFTSREKCLFDSLAMTLFLARQGLAVRWVIGVTTHPFSAHSWVQDGAEVLNDLHERVRRFAPLLVV